MSFRSVQTPARLSEQVQSQLEAAILDGRFKMNVQLPTEAELCEQFGVSRTVVREAIQRLEAQGLVQSRVGRGSFVAPYPMSQVGTAMGRFAALNADRDVFLHMLDLRLVIESETSGRVAEGGDKKAIADLRDIVQTMERSADDLETFARADMDFHLRIAAASDNPFFAEILRPLKNVGQAFGLATYEPPLGPRRVSQEHALILDAIAAGDAMLARQRMREHIEFSRSHYLAMIEGASAAEERR